MPAWLAPTLLGGAASYFGSRLASKEADRIKAEKAAAAQPVMEAYQTLQPQLMADLTGQETEQAARQRILEDQLTRAELGSETAGSRRRFLDQAGRMGMAMSRTGQGITAVPIQARLRAFDTDARNAYSDLNKRIKLARLQSAERNRQNAMSGMLDLAKARMQATPVSESSGVGEGLMSVGGSLLGTGLGKIS